MQPGWVDAAEDSSGTERKHGTTKLKVAAVILLQMADYTVPSGSTTVGEPMEMLDGIHRNRKCRNCSLDQDVVIWG
jgi:hypothetical protein